MPRASHTHLPTLLLTLSLALSYSPISWAGAGGSGGSSSGGSGGSGSGGSGSGGSDSGSLEGGASDSGGSDDSSSDNKGSQRSQRKDSPEKDRRQRKKSGSPSGSDNSNNSDSNVDISADSTPAKQRQPAQDDERLQFVKANLETILEEVAAQRGDTLEALGKLYRLAPKTIVTRLRPELDRLSRIDRNTAAEDIHELLMAANKPPLRNL